MNFKIEICVDSVQSALYAQNAGASRVELCSNLPEGGTTPGYGTIVSARKNLSIILHVIIRPRGGDFLYSESEYDIMRREIDICGEARVDGVVLGILKSDGRVDVERTARLVELAKPMSATFHRAFDLCLDPVTGLEDVIASGTDRLLTAGQKNSAYEGSGLLKDLVFQAGKRITIMPGSGINEGNIEDIAKMTGANEFHLSARKEVESDMIFRKAGITMGGAPGYNEYSRKVADPEKIRRIISILVDL